MKTPKIELITEKSKLAEGTPETVPVLLRITPPEIETPTERPQMNLSLVLDRSGSMNGDKIEQAKLAAAHCVEQLLPADRMSVVIFDDRIETLIPSAPTANPELYKRLIGRIHVGGSTALHEAWVKGGIEVSEHLDDRRVNRVILITDGQANVGETRTGTIVAQARELAKKGVSTSTIGIGRDFNEELLVPMADAGEGNAWHVQEAGDMARIFEAELGGALNQFAREVSLRIVPRDGVRITDVMNDFERDAAGGYVLPNLISGRPLEIVVEAALPAGAAGETLAAFDVELRFTDQRSAEHVTASATLSVEFATVEAVDGLPEDTAVREAIVLLANARARAEAIRDMDRGNYDAARQHVRAAHAMSMDIAIGIPSAALFDEVSKLEAELNELDSRDLDAMTRKKMRYAAELRRKGR